MTAVGWVGLFLLVSVAGALFLARAMGLTNDESAEHDDLPAEPVWGCDCCQDEAEEIAALEAVWDLS